MFVYMKVSFCVSSYNQHALKNHTNRMLRCLGISGFAAIELLMCSDVGANVSDVCQQFCVQVSPTTSSLTASAGMLGIGHASFSHTLVCTMHASWTCHCPPLCPISLADGLRC